MALNILGPAFATIASNDADFENRHIPLNMKKSTL